MKRSLVVALILTLSAGTALAAPGDPRVVQGTLEWPAALASEPFVVIRGDDGRMYYTDISGAQRRTPGPLTAGARISAVGVEGMRPFEIAALALGGGDVTALGIDPSSLPAPSSSPAAAPQPSALPAAVSAAPAEPLWRLDGTVQSVAGTSVTLRRSDGHTSTVDASQLSETTLTALRPGDRISLFGVPRADRKLVANGFVQSSAPTPAASPR
jgi:hypothetical protein